MIMTINKYFTHPYRPTKLILDWMNLLFPSPLLCSLIIMQYIILYMFI